MVQPFLGEIKLVPYSFAPKGWAMCNGQTLNISQNSALFALLGTMYGGNGTTTFGLPNLQGRVVLHRSQNGQYPQGSMAGVENETLSLSEMPMHSHGFIGTSDIGDARQPLGNMLAKASANGNFYGQPGPIQSLNPTSISTAGGGQAHNNMQPFLVMTYVIALTGIFPSRN